MAQAPKKPSAISRRFFMGLGAATAAGSLLPVSFQKAMALPPAPGGLQGVEHVIVLMQENRSFDHYFGTLQGVQGFADKTVLRRRNSDKTLFEQSPSGSDSTIMPFLARDAVNKDQKNIEFLASLPHSWGDGGTAVAGGWWDQWIPAKGAASMAGYDRQDIPFQFELADKFTICDAYHCSITTGTSPNRNYLVSGHTGYEPGTNQRAVTNAAYNARHPGYEWKAYTEYLSDAGVSWQVMQEWDNFTDNNTEYFRAYKLVANKVLGALNLGQNFLNMENFYSAVRAASPARRTEMQNRLNEVVATLSEREQEMFNGALRRGEDGSLTNQFRTAVESGTLPKVTYLVASAADCEHPASSSPIQSSNIVYDILQVFGDNPELWQKSVFLINYDEFDGYFDHVPAPRPEPSMTDEFYQGSAMGLGPRVPMTVISPWSVGGWVCSEVFDHTSVVKFLETWTGVKSEMLTDWRRATVGDLTSALNFEGAPVPALPTVTQPGPIPPFNGRWAAQPPSAQAMPAQEPGVRASRPLPYALDASFAVSNGTLTITVKNDGDRPAPIAIYNYADTRQAPIHANVSGSRTFTLPGSGGIDVVVTGPNRFRRDFASSSGDVSVAATADHSAQRLSVQVANASQAKRTMRLASSAKNNARPLVLPAGKAKNVGVDARDKSGWYEVEIVEDGFRYWATGHLNNGKASVTSPFGQDADYPIA